VICPVGTVGAMAYSKWDSEAVFEVGLSLALKKHGHSRTYTQTKSIVSEVILGPRPEVDAIPTGAIVGYVLGGLHFDGSIIVFRNG
jgi:hypothetical protein